MSKNTNIMSIVTSKEGAPMARIGGLLLDCEQASSIEQAILARFHLLSLANNPNLYQEDHVLTESTEEPEEVILQINTEETGVIVLLAGTEKIEMAWRDWSYILQQVVMACGNGYIPALNELVDDIEKAKARDNRGFNKLPI